MTTRHAHRTVLTFAVFSLVLGFAFLLTPIGARAGEVREADEFVAVGGGKELPPGWCYSDAVGTYPCHFQVKLPPEFDSAGDCPEGFVRDRASGKCINDQLSVPDPVPADEGSSEIVQSQLVEFDPDGFLCPEGWVQATPPLNWQLGCLPNTFVAES
ncbi:MAG: hypothetical protein ACRDJW_22615 [Thermomicrobiales bacterium]